MNRAQGLNPLQKLWQDRALEQKISAYMQRAFNQSLLVNRHAGASIHLHIGEVTEPEPRIGERTAYNAEVMKLPLLQNQGAGMLAFMGTVLTLATSDYQIVLLDEPEAFLHPPQARLLGEIVAEMSRNGGPQVIAATHSDDFVQGVLGGSRDDSHVSIARRTRPTPHENRVAQVPADAVRTLYRDPLLRYSNIMDGIFYKGTVLCEAESDCTYYAAVLGHVEHIRNLGASDLLFTQCGGKDRFHRAFQALNAAAVPTAIIADVDLLADRQKFRELLDGMGGNFAAIEASYNVLDSSVANMKVTPKRSDTREAMLSVLDSGTSTELTKRELTALNEAIRAEAGWKQLKRKGEAAIDTGDPTNAFASIVAACNAVGLFIVRNGELERFHANVPGSKQEWLRKVLETVAFKTSTSAAEFLLQVRTYINSLQ